MSKRTVTRRSPRATLITHQTALITLLLALAMATAGCGARRTPDLARVFAPARERTGKRPVIVIPGILGSGLVNRHTGEVVWPSAIRSSSDGLSLPTTPDLAANRDDLVPSRIIDTARLIRLIPADVYVYYELLGALKNYAGYREGNWNEPGPDGDRDTFYVFAYDWRRDNVETARELLARVEALKEKLGRPDLRFNVIAHSMGGLVARYAAMYGGRDLTEDAGHLTDGVAHLADDASRLTDDASRQSNGARTPRPDWSGARHINKIFMFGTPNAGSMEALATLLEGYSITEGLRRRVRLLNKLSREDALTIPSIYQLLPHAGTARFLDENLRPLEGVDIYDPATWERFGWGAIHDARFRERFERGELQGEMTRRDRTSLAELDAYFAAVLLRARRFQEALDATAPAPAPVQLFAFGGDCEETLTAPVIYRDAKSGRWVTRTSPANLRDAAGRKLSRREVVAAMFEPGDGRVTRRSLLGETLTQPRANQLFATPLPIAYAVFACDLHSEVQNNKMLQDNALTLLIGELTS